MSTDPRHPPAFWSPPTSAPSSKYHIVKPLKLGGTAAIYLAIMRGENNFSREVVIKRPLPHLVAEPRSRSMFIDEAHIASRLSHPNICQVLDLVAREDELYIVLEYLRGVDLREIIKRSMQLGRSLPPEVAVWIAVELAAGLDYAHFATTVDGRPLNLVHRDVSPKNIRITFEGSVKVIDFGIARAEHRITQTSVGTIKGTLGYMSPEQILGDDIDRRSDIFAFGIVLFQMLTLRNPFDGATLKERVRKLTQAPIPSVRDLNPALDDDIAAIVSRCLERDVHLRYERLADVQQALDQYLARLQVVSPRQRLIGFMREIFPSLDDVDQDLKSALSEISHLTGPVDASVPLRFPDDPPTEKLPPRGQLAASAATRPATGATEPADPGTRADRPGTTNPLAVAAGGEDPTFSPRQGFDGFEVAATRPPPNPLTPDDDRTAREWSDPGIADTRRLLDLDRDPGRRPPEPSGLSTVAMVGMGAAAMAVAIVVTVLSWPAREVRTAPLLEIPRTEPPAEPEPLPTQARGERRGSNRESESRNNVRADARIDKVRTPKKRRRSDKARADRVARADRDRARLMFQTGVRLGKRGRLDEAALMYELAYVYSGHQPNPSIYLNLGLLHNSRRNDARAKACLQGYLERRPSAPQAARVRTLLSSFPALPSVACVDRAATARARKAETRRGAEIRRWLDETLAERLR